MTQQTIDRIRKFTEDRDWDQFHTPADLAKSIAIEACELLEKGEYFSGILYSVLSVVFCIIGIVCGKKLSGMIR